MSGTFHLMTGGAFSEDRKVNTEYLETTWLNEPGKNLSRQAINKPKITTTIYTFIEA
jgi:hypothetical protein